MKINMKEYGTILTSRPAGREASLVLLSNLHPEPGESIELDFNGVISVGPSWLDEVLISLRDRFGRDRIVCLPSGNPSVLQSLKIIDHPED